MDDTFRGFVSSGFGMSHAHHGELFQGQIEDSHGRKRRCLMTLPCPFLWSKVVITPDRSEALHVEPRHKQKVIRVVQATFENLQIKGIGGQVAVSSNIEEAKGYGSSTADCVAAARAAANVIGRRLSEREIARIVVSNETASDNTMFQRAVLFAQREGLVLEDYQRPFPNLEIIGVDTEPTGYIDTLRYPPAEYQWQHLQTFKVLVNAIRCAFRTGDLALLGRVATASATINQQFLPKGLFPELLKLADLAQILGVSVAHTGTVAGLVLNPDDPKLENKAEQLIKGLADLGLTEVIRFSTSGNLVSREQINESSSNYADVQAPFDYA
jgi:uncharacterized protein involved in propanediol utilization